jgi:hypothetical protein
VIVIEHDHNVFFELGVELMDKERNNALIFQTQGLDLLQALDDLLPEVRIYPAYAFNKVMHKGSKVTVQIVQTVPYRVIPLDSLRDKGGFPVAGTGCYGDDLLFGISDKSGWSLSRVMVSAVWGDISFE